jgi:hypothetical protein
VATVIADQTVEMGAMIDVDVAGADDGNGGMVDDVFDVTVSAAANRAPTVTSAIGPQDVEATSVMRMMTLSPSRP